MECEDPNPDVGWGPDPYRVVCLTCGAQGPFKSMYQDEEQSEALWNNRV